MSYIIPDELTQKLMSLARAKNITLEELLEQVIDDEKTSVSFLAATDEMPFQEVVESQLELICRYTPDTKLTFVNDAYCHFFNIKREDVIGHSFLPFTISEEYAPIQQRITEILNDPSPTIKEYRAIDAENRLRWIQWVDYGITDTSGEVMMIQAVGRDITHLRETQKYLEKQERYYRMLFDRNPLPMWVIDIETLGFLAVNDAAIRIYGYSREEFLATTTEILHLEADIPKVIDIIHKNPQGFSYTTQWQHRKKDATLIDVDVVSHGVVFNERPARLVLVNDITTRRQLEEERLYAKELAIELEKEREIIELKERFISIVSHEFRTPLSVILSSVDILRIYFDRLTRERITEKLGGIADQVQHMGDLLDDVLMIGRHNAKRVNFVPEPQDIVRLLNTAIEHVRMGDEDRHQFILNFQLQDTMMLVDKRLLEHVFLNLIGNAVKYSPVGTNIYINVKQSNQDIIFSVRDEGIGIPPDDQSRMFEPFYRAKNAFDKRGTGLGLAIVKQSVEAHQGRLTFESQPGQGSTFNVVLPTEYEDV